MKAKLNSFIILKMKAIRNLVAHYFFIQITYYIFIINFRKIMQSKGVKQISLLSDIQPDYLQQYLPLYTSRHQSCLNSNKKINESFIKQTLGLYPNQNISSYPTSQLVIQSSKQNQMQQQKPEQLNLNINIYKKYITLSKFKLNSQIKKKLNNRKNKNINFFRKKTKNIYVIDMNQKMLHKLRTIKGINDPTKSLTFFFIQLGLLRQYRSNEDLFKLFDRVDTIKKNKMTQKCTEQQQEIIFEEMQFYKYVAMIFYENPIKAVLLAYLRNHSEQKLLKKGKLDDFTRKGIQQTLTTLSQQPFFYQFKNEDI